VKLKMAPNSMFAVLLRSRWWVSFAAAGVMVLLARLILPTAYEVYALFAAIPLVVVGAVAAWRQLRAPSAARVAKTHASVSAMAWPQFAAALEAGFGRDGYEVTRVPGPAADFVLLKEGRVTLVSGKRWKAARTGIEPLRDLQAAMVARDAPAGLYVALGELTDNARSYAAGHHIDVLQADGLARLLRGAGR
jgi:restriction system protein